MAIIQQIFKPTYIDLNVEVGINAFSELLYDVDAIRGSLYNLFTTPIGSRVFVPEYGSRFLFHVQEPADDTTVTIMKMDIYQEVQKWEPRVILDMGGIVVNPVWAGYQILLTYIIKQSGLRSNFQLSVSR